MGADVMENEFYRVSVDKPTVRVTIFDKELNREVAKDMEVAAVEERGGNYVAIEPLSGRTIFNSIDKVDLEETNAIRTVLKLSGHIADIPIVQRCILYRDAKRVDLENTIQWKGPRSIRVQQLFPYTQSNAQIHYGVPFGANAASNIMPGTGPHQWDEITRESWLESRQILDWVFAGNTEWGLTIAMDHQLIKLSDGVIRAEMLRGTRHTSVRVVRGEEITSLFYPPPGTYHFKFSLSSGRGDWKAAKSYRAGMNLNNPLLPVEVVDQVSRKSLPPTRSFCSLAGDHLVISAAKKTDADDAVVLRFYDVAGARSETPVEFLGQRRSFQEVNLLEEQAQKEQQVATVVPYEIKTIKLWVGK